MNKRGMRASGAWMDVKDVKKDAICKLLSDKILLEVG
jgi:hypothetical protein